MGTALAGWLTPGLLALAPEVVRSQAPHLDGRLVVFALVAVMATAGITGLVPAVRTSRADLQTLLKEGLGHAGTRRGARLRGAVIVGELAIALALLSGAGLLLKSFVRLQQVEAGIDPRGVLAMSLNLPAAKYPEERPPQFFNALIAKVSALPGVRAAAVTSILPFGGDWDRIAVDVEGRPVLRGSEKPEADRYIVSPGYHVAMGVPLRQGRLLEDADRYDGALVCLVDEVFARRLQTAGSVLGMRLRLPGRDQFATIVGVVGHVKHYGLDATSSGQIYMSQNQYRWRWMHLVTRTAGDPLALATVARTAVRALDPEQPVFGVTTMAALMAERTAARRFVLTLLGGFAAVALALAGLGLYGVLAYAVSQRTREIGIRLALGADAGRVVRMVVRSGAILAGAGLALGLATAWAFRGLLSRMLFHVGPTDLAVFALVGLVLAAVALLASWLPARRAARVDPMVALKCD
jgi:putative ABC transport system permease protein